MIAEGWTMGLNAGSSVPEGGCSFTFMTCAQDSRKGSAPWLLFPTPAGSSSGGPGAPSFYSMAPRKRETPLPAGSHPAPSRPALRGGRHDHVTLGTADWNTMLRMGWGAVLSMETTTTSTSERPGSGVTSKVEEDPEAMLVVHGHRQDAAWQRRGNGGTGLEPEHI